MPADFKRYLRTLLKRVPTLEIQQETGYIYRLVVDESVLDEHVVGGTMADKIKRMLDKNNKVKATSFAWSYGQGFTRRSLLVQMKA